MVAGLCMVFLGFAVLIGYLFCDTILAKKKESK